MPKPGQQRLRVPQTPQKLEECIHLLSSITSRNVLSSSTNKSIQEIGDLYMATLSLLYHLKTDQVRLARQHRHQTRRGNNNHHDGVETKNPQQHQTHASEEEEEEEDDETPAMSAVLQDPRLFRALLACLKVPSLSSGFGTNDHGDLVVDSNAILGGCSSSAAAVATVPTYLSRLSSSYATSAAASIPTNRKRSMSYASEHDYYNSNNILNHHTSSAGAAATTSNSASGSLSKKSLKSMHSPTPGRSHLSSLLKDSLSTTAATAAAATMIARPYWNVSVVAACIFYAAYAHLDHWPVALVKAYAEDCFGARHWVDAEECRLLVQNLALVHASVTATTTTTTTTSTNTEAAVAASTPTSSAMDSMMEKGPSLDDNDDQRDRAKEASIMMDYFKSLETMDIPTTSSNSASRSPVPMIRTAAATPTPTAGVSSAGSVMLRRASTSSDPGGSTTAQLPPPRFQSVSSTSNESVLSYNSSISGSKIINSSKGSTIKNKGNEPSLSLNSLPLFRPGAATSTKNNNNKTSSTLSNVSNSNQGSESDDDESPIKMTKSYDDDDGGSSSSSGEEDEEVVAVTESFDANAKTNTTKLKDATDVRSRASAPLEARRGPLNLSRIRPRYFGVNLDHAHRAITTSLSTRLDVKSKQNSGLLQALPNFCAVPAVRSLVTQQLERWLQSPALSGLARSLFVATVHNMKHIQPTLPEDVEAIDTILRMKLKANQLNAHIENVTAIAKRIPTAAVSRQIYTRLLREVLDGMNSIDRTNSDHLKMLTAVHNAFPPNLSAEGLGEALLTLLAHPDNMSHINSADNNNSINNAQSRPQRDRLVQKLRTILRDIAAAFGPSFDGCGLLEALLSFDMQVDYWAMRDEEDKGRLMFQCAILMAGTTYSANSDPKTRGAPSRGRRGSNFEEDAGMRSRRNSSFDDDLVSRNRRNSSFVEMDTDMLRKKVIVGLVSHRLRQLLLCQS